MVISNLAPLNSRESSKHYFTNSLFPFVNHTAFLAGHDFAAIDR